jgi:hypothetical protein
MTANGHQRERRQHSGRDAPRAGHGFDASGGGGGGVLLAWSSILCASLCSSAAAVRSASEPLRRTSGTISSLMYLEKRRRSSSRCVAASRNCCSHFRFDSSFGMRAPLRHQLDDFENPTVNVDSQTRTTTCRCGNLAATFTKSMQRQLDIQFARLLKRRAQSNKAIRGIATSSHLMARYFATTYSSANPIACKGDFLDNSKCSSQTESTLHGDRCFG